MVSGLEEVELHDRTGDEFVVGTAQNGRVAGNGAPSDARMDSARGLWAITSGTSIDQEAQPPPVVPIIRASARLNPWTLRRPWAIFLGFPDRRPCRAAGCPA